MSCERTTKSAEAAGLERPLVALLPSGPGAVTGEVAQCRLHSHAAGRGLANGVENAGRAVRPARTKRVDGAGFVDEARSGRGTCRGRDAEGAQAPQILGRREGEPLDAVTAVLGSVGSRSLLDGIERGSDRALLVGVEDHLPPLAVVGEHGLLDLRDAPRVRRIELRPYGVHTHPPALQAAL